MKKLKEKIFHPQNVGTLQAKEGMRVATGKEGSGPILQISLLVDESDGVIADAKFQAYGPSHLIAAAEIACDFLVRKTYDQASRMSADLIDQHVQEGFPEESNAYLNMVIMAIEEAAQKCSGIPFAKTYEATPINPLFEGEGIPGFSSLTKSEKLKIIDEVVEKEIRPFIELDAGGIEVVDLEGDELSISYQGSCTSCYAATGSTLSAIKNILNARVDKNLSITPIL